MKIGMYWAAGCGGCDISLLEIGPHLLELIEVADVAFWPCAADIKYQDMTVAPDGCLDVYGLPHPLVFDPRLRDAVRAWVEQPELGRSRHDEASAEERTALLHTIQEEINAYNWASRRLTEARQGEVVDRDATILGLQAELHQKVGECNRIIGELQAELHAKVGERDRTKLIRQVCHDEAARLRAIRPGVPRDLETVVLKCLAQEPAGRHADDTDCDSRGSHLDLCNGRHWHL